MQYICVVYVYKINTLFMRPMKSLHDPDIVVAFTSVYDKLVATGHQSKYHILDSKCTHAVQHVLD